MDKKENKKDSKKKLNDKDANKVVGGSLNEYERNKRIDELMMNGMRFELAKEIADEEYK